MVTWIVQNTRVILSMILKYYKNALCSHRKIYFIHDIAHCQNSKSTRAFQECKGIPILEWLGNWGDMNTIENVWNIMKRSVTKCHAKKEEMWKLVCEARYCVAPNVLEELNNSMPRRITFLIIAKGDTKKYWLYDVGLQFCCVFIGMYLKYVVVFNWNITNIYLQLLPDYTLILFMETKWHKQLLIGIVKHRIYMYNKMWKNLWNIA